MQPVCLREDDMKKLIGLLCLNITILLAGCGGGGGGSAAGGSVYVYNGKTTPAVLTTDNTQRFFRFLFTGIMEDPSTGGIMAVSKNVVVRRSISTAITGKTISKTLAATTPVEGTINGTVSGYATYSGTLDENNGTGVITFIYSNFNSGDGYRYDGTVRITINALDLTSETILDAQLQLNALTMTSNQEQFMMQGSMHLHVNVATMTETMILNIDGRMTPSTEPFRLENLTAIVVYDNLNLPTSSTDMLTGRIYLGNEGYVEISETTPLRFDYLGRFNVDIPNSGGPLLFSGASSSKARITPLSISQLMIEVDSNGDTLFESSITDLWTNQVGIVYSWETVHGTAGFEVANSAQETSDGGAISTGYTNTGTEKALDVYLVKTNAAGDLLWTKTFGGTDDDVGWSLQQTSDGGIIIAGTAGTSGYIIKTDIAGDIVWERRLDGELASRIYSVRQTSDGGYILGGSIDSFSPGTGVVGYGGEDMYLVKLDSQGNVLWGNRFGGSGTDVGWSVKETSQGGFVLVGVTDSFDYAQKREQLYLVATDTNGTRLWENNYGDELSQYGYDVEPATGGDLVVTGYSATLNSGNVYYLARLSGSGVLLLEKTFGSTDSLNHRNDLVITADGGYIITGNNSFDVHLFRMDSNGSLWWSRTFNWSQYLTMCTAASVSNTSDGGYLIAGSAWPNTGKDFFLIKTDEDGGVGPDYL